jgi:hypothetical protein
MLMTGAPTFASPGEKAGNAGIALQVERRAASVLGAATFADAATDLDLLIGIAVGLHASFPHIGESHLDGTNTPSQPDVGLRERLVVCDRVRVDSGVVMGLDFVYQLAKTLEMVAFVDVHVVPPL